MPRKYMFENVPNEQPPMHMEEFEFINGGEDGEVSLWHTPCDTQLLEPVPTMKEAFEVTVRHDCPRKDW